MSMFEPYLGKVQELANRNELGQEAAEKAKIKYGGKEEATARQIRHLEAQRQEAADSVSKAQEEVDRLQRLPDIPEPPFQDELVRAQNAVVAREPGTCRILDAVFCWIIGASH